MTQLLQSLLIRQRIWVLVGLSMLGLIALATLAIQKAQNQYMALKKEQYVKMANTAKQLVNFYYEAYQRGEIGYVEARKLARAAVNSLALDNRNYYYIYNSKYGLLVTHPFITAVYTDDTPEQIADAVKTNVQGMADLGELLGLDRPAISGFDVFKQVHPDLSSGFFEYYMYLDEEKRGIVQTPDDPNLSEQAELKMGYGTVFEPWDWAIITSIYLDDVKAAFYHWLVSMVAIAGGIILILFLCAWAISRSITKPLQATVDLMADISHGTGDLTKHLIVEGRNELVTFAQGFNVFVEKIANIIGQVLSSNHQVISHSQHLSDVINETVSRTDQQLAETEMLASATNELSYSLNGVSERAQNTANAAKSAQEAAENSQRAMQSNINSVNQLSDALLNTQSEVESMENFSNKVSQVLEVIVGIAEQTNLLALNAAIEAARAGEQGRGFAVVADEVRTLAQRTQQSTTEIHDIVANLENGTLNVVKAMQQGLESSETCVRTATESNQTLQQVLQYIDEISSMNIDIAAAVEEQSTATQEIAQSSQKIAASSKQNLEASESSKQENIKLKQQLDQMASLVKQFRT